MNIHCQLTKDVSYRQVMPTFHHWQIDERKFGLKFMSTYEACKFHNRLQKAVEHLYRQSKSSKFFYFVLYFFKNRSTDYTFSPGSRVIRFVYSVFVAVQN